MQRSIRIRTRACTIGTRLILALVGLLSLVMSAGCGRSAAPTASNQTASNQTAASSEAPATVPDPFASTEPAPESDELSEEPSEESSEELAAAETESHDLDDGLPEDGVLEDTVEEAPATQDDADAEAIDTPAQTSANDGTPKSEFNLWLPTTRGPLLIGLSVSIGDQPLEEVFDTVVGQTLQDVRVALELDDNETLSWEQLIEHASENPAVFGQNASQIAQQAEQMEKRYDRNKNNSVDPEEWRSFLFRDSNVSTALRVFGTDAFRYLNRSDSKLFQAIDRNQDRRIDGPEADSAKESLLAALDQNADECLEIAECLEPITTPMQNNRDPWQSRRPNRQGNVPMDLSGFVNWSNLAYTLGGMVQSPSPLATFHPVKMIDEDSDQVISEQEAASLANLEPAIIIEVHFDPVDPQHPKTRITALPDNKADLQSLSDTAIELDRLSVSLSVSDQMLTPKSIWTSQVRGRCAEHPDALFAWLDVNRDNRLTSREIHAAPGKIKALLQSGKELKASDFPDSILIQIIRGDAAQDASRFAIAPSSTTDDSRPRWAIVMDSNQDGDLSENEFIGPITAFRRLDTNQDRYLDASEIVAVETEDSEERQLRD